jgi:hypothetical protein
MGWQPVKISSRDAMLDKIAEMTKKREACLKQIELWIESDPELFSILEDIRLSLI